MGKKVFDQKAEDIAQIRLEIIMPLLENGIDKGKLQQLISLQCEKHGISQRTVKRYLDSYQKDGYKGLYPMDRTKRAKKRRHYRRYN